MTLSDIHYEPLVRLAHYIKIGDISPVEVTEALISRIERFNTHLKAYHTVTADLAMDQARQAEKEIFKGIYRGPLHGIPIAVKDLCFTKGIKTTGGMAAFADFKPDHDSTVVKNLRQSGAVLLGKLHMTEGATVEHHPDFPEPVNPWREDLWTGVSSSGSAIALAAGMAFATIGSDTGGSIRFPSACNNVTGLKPTWGRVSRHGVFDLAPTFDHLGPMARSALDAAVTLEGIAGHDPSDPTSLPDPVPAYARQTESINGARGLRVGFDWEAISSGTDEGSNELIGGAIEVLRNIGTELHETQFPDASSLFEYISILTMSEMAVAHDQVYAANAHLYGVPIREGMEHGLSAKPIDLAKGYIERQIYRSKIVKFFEHFDAFIMPVFHSGTPTWNEVRNLVANDMNSLLRFTSPLNAAGNPSITLPCGQTDDGRPVAFQLVGAHGAEASLLKLAHAYQQATDWHTFRPQDL